MIQTIKYWFTNWIDGIKLNKPHLINESNAATYQLSQGLESTLNPYNYGLLPDAGTGNVKPFAFVNNGQQVEVRFQHFRAITPGGHIMDLDETDATPYHLTAMIPDAEKNTDCFIVLVVKPYTRVPYGNADPEEVPLRQPYVVPDYTLQLIPASETGKNTLGKFHLPIGRLKTAGQKVMYDEAYIPPCSCISSHEKLVELHASVQAFLANMQSYAMHIIQKNLQKKQQPDWMAVVNDICERVSVFTATNSNGFRLISLYQPPVFLINTMASFANLLQNSLDIYTGSYKEEFLNYCAEDWCNISQSRLESVVRALAHQDYNHLAIGDSMVRVEEFRKTIEHLFSKLSGLPHIGTQKNGPFISEYTRPRHKASNIFLAE